MRIRLFCLILSLVMAMPVLSQEQEATEAAPDSAAADAAEADEADGGEAEDEADDADLDIQTYEEPDDVFIPTEEIPSDEPIPFPSNI